MKPTFLDRFIGLFSPEAELRRIRARTKTDLTLRAYDVAKTFNSSDWTSANGSSANAELKAAIKPGREKARSLVQNDPYGRKAVSVIVNETVGAGIIPKIQARTKRQSKELNKLWKQFAETSKCDFDGRHNFYGLQALALRATVESGEGLGIFRLEADGLKIQLLESDHIATDKDTGNSVQGINFDSSGRRVSYILYKKHPGDAVTNQETVEISVTNITHVYLQERAGQVRGITWAAAVVEKMNDFKDYQATTLIRQKIAACFTAFVTTSGSDSLLSAADLKEKRENEYAMEPATVKFLNQGEDVKIANPPGVDGYAEFNRESLRAIAAGFGISYEALTGDYSQSNYSSSRLGQIQMRRNIDMWRWNLLIPQFCDPYFTKFLEWAKLRGVDVKDVTVQWVPPANIMIDPTKEVKALREEVRAGFKTYGQAVREQGLDPEETLVEIAEWNKRFDDLKLTFDSDPRRLSNVGFAHPSETLPKLSDAEYLKPDETEEGANSEEQKDSEGSDEPIQSSSKSDDIE